MSDQHPSIPVVPCPTPFFDHIVGTVDTVDLPIRIWPAVEAQEEQAEEVENDGENTGDDVDKTAQRKRNRPWVFWVHGGAFLYGKHYAPNSWVIPAFRTLGYHVVSVSYRFVPQVTPDDIVSDVSLAYTWCREHLPSVLEDLDLDSYLTAGDSAGAHLALWAGQHFEPRPKIVVDMYGLTELSDSFYEQPVPSFPFPLLGTSIPQLHTEMYDRNPRNAVVTAPFILEIEPFASLEDLRIAWGLPNYIPGEGDVIRADMNTYTFKNGLKLPNIFRREMFNTQEKYIDELKRWSACFYINEKRGYPPTMIVHGLKDTIVPVSQGRKLGGKLREIGVEVGECYVEDADHLFEMNLSDPNDPLWGKAIVPILEFCKKHLGSVTDKRDRGDDHPGARL